MREYNDRNGLPVSVGDILYYNEGKDSSVGASVGIHEVVIIDGDLCGQTHLYNNLNDEWVKQDIEDIVSLIHYTSSFDGKSDLKLNDAEVIGHVDSNKDMLTLEWAIENKPIITEAKSIPAYVHGESIATESKEKWQKRYTLGELISTLNEVADIHGKDVPIGRIGHFGEVHFADKYMVQLSISTRDMYEEADSIDWNNKTRRKVPILVELDMPDIGKEPN